MERRTAAQPDPSNERNHLIPHTHTVTDNQNREWLIWPRPRSVEARCRLTGRLALFRVKHSESGHVTDVHSDTPEPLAQSLLPKETADRAPMNEQTEPPVQSERQREKWSGLPGGIISGKEQCDIFSARNRFWLDKRIAERDEEKKREIDRLWEPKTGSMWDEAETRKMLTPPPRDPEPEAS